MANTYARSCIYPAKEMKAVDMAEIMKAALFLHNGKGIIQGCRFSVTGNGQLQMTSGRAVILGRLAEFSSGFLDPPSVNENTTCLVVMVCDLNPPQDTESFYAAILTNADVSALEIRSGQINDEFFNVNNGLKYFVVGNCVVAPGGTVSNFQQNATYYPLQSNRSVLTAEIATVNTTIGNLDSRENGHYTGLNTRVGNLETTSGSQASSINTINGNINTINNKKVVSDADITACTATIASLGAGATMTIFLVPGYSGTQWPASNSSSASTTERQRYAANTVRAEQESNVLTSNNQVFVGMTRLESNNNNVIITGWNCSTSDGKCTVKIRNLANSAQSNITVSGKALLLAEKIIQRI